MIITPLNPDSVSLETKSFVIDSLISDVNAHTLSLTAKIAAACFVIIGWAYWAYQNWQKTASLAKLKDKVLEISGDSEGLPYVKNIYSQALQILGKQLNPLELEAAKFSHKVLKEIKGVFGIKGGKSSLEPLEFSLYHGLARSLISEKDFAKFNALPNYEQKIRFSERVLRANIDRPINKNLLTNLRKKLIELEDELKTNNPLTEFFAQKYRNRLEKVDDIIDSVIADKTHTVNSTQFQFGATYFQNIFAVLNEFQKLSLKHKNEALSIAFRIAMSKSQNLDEISDKLPLIASRVDKCLDYNKGHFIFNYINCFDQKKNSIAPAEQFLETYEKDFLFPATNKKQDLPDLDDYEIAEETTISVDSEVEDQEDDLRDLDDYIPHQTYQERGYFRRGLDYLSSWVI